MDSRIFKSVVIAFFLFAFMPQAAEAATMDLTPAAGSFTVKKPFAVDLVIDGKTQAFNAAEARVNASPTLSISGLTIGNCNFAFLALPSIANPSFTGVILGGSSRKCTVYTLTLTPTTEGTGSITITHGSVKQYGDASEIFTAAQNSSYKLTAANPLSLDTLLPNATPPPQSAVSKTTSSQSSDNAYTLNVQVLAQDGTPLTDAVVNITPQLQASGASPKQSTTDIHGMATFTDLPSNTYTVTTTHQGKQISETIMHVGGNQHVLTLGMQEEKASFNPLPLAIGGVALVAIALLYIFRNRLREFLKRKK